jgi:hypothetical protein
MALGKYDRAREYFQLQSGNEYEKAGGVEIFVREGKKDEALQELKSLSMTAFYGRPLLEPCLRHRPPAKGDVPGQQVRSVLMAGHDPFPKYVLAGQDSYCDHPDLALGELRRAISQNYAPIQRWKQILCWPKFARCQSLLNTLLRHRVPAALFGAPETEGFGNEGRFACDKLPTPDKSPPGAQTDYRLNPPGNSNCDKAATKSQRKVLRSSLGRATSLLSENKPLPR